MEVPHCTQLIIFLDFMLPTILFNDLKSYIGWRNLWIWRNSPKISIFTSIFFASTVCWRTMFPCFNRNYLTLLKNIGIPNALRRSSIFVKLTRCYSAETRKISRKPKNILKEPIFYAKYFRSGRRSLDILQWILWIWQVDSSVSNYLYLL